MTSRKLVVWAAALVAAATAAVAAGAALGVTPSAAQMTLRSTDLPGAKASGRATKAGGGYAAGYERMLELSRPYGPSQIVFIESDIDLANTLSTATRDFAGFRTFLRSSKGREQLAAAIVKSAGKPVVRKDLTLGKLSTPRIGDETIELVLTLRIKKVPIYMALTFFRVDRVVAVLRTVGARPAVQSDVVKLGSFVVKHIGEQFVPFADVAPGITGTPQQGQTLSASAGTWSNTPTLAYQWQRCDATGAACADVPGATTQTYAVLPTDVGATFRVTVTGTNRFGKAVSQSTQTAAVT